MSTIVVGVGHQASLRKVLHILDAELQRTQGAPRRLVAKAGSLEVVGFRHLYEGEFEGFILRLKGDAKSLERLAQTFAQSPTSLSVTDIDGGKEFRCELPGESGDAAMCLLDEISTHFRLPEIWRVHGEEFRHSNISIESLFRVMVSRHASDVHLFPGSSPVIRVDNLIEPVPDTEPLSAEQILALIRDSSHEHEWKEFQTDLQCSYNYHQVGLGYSRISAFIKSGVPHCTIRFLPEKIPSFEDLHIPRSTMETLGKLDYGLILVTGMTGSGKSTTVASLIDWINSQNRVHVVTIEEPVEYVHSNRKAIISQRDVGVDVRTFSDAVRGALRHDPDVIFIGEMRDQATIRAAIAAAATGHLVISTLHSNTSAEVVNRIVSFFDPIERDLVKLQLRDAIKCVMCQRLLPKVGGGRVPAIEFLFNDTKQINDYILTGDTIGIREGMQQIVSQSAIFEDSLLSLYKQDLISLDAARHHASFPEVFEQKRLGTYQPPTLEPHV